MVTEMMERAGWHLDKRVPVALIVAMLSQFAIGVWFASKLDTRVEQLERNQAVQAQRDDRQDRDAQANQDRTERNAADAIAQMRNHLDRIDAKLDRLIESRGMK